MESDEARLKRLDNEVRLLAQFMLGITPDKNTQTPEVFASIEAEIEEIVERYRPYKAA